MNFTSSHVHNFKLLSHFRNAHPTAAFGLEPAVPEVITAHWPFLPKKVNKKHNNDNENIILYIRNCSNVFVRIYH